MWAMKFFITWFYSVLTWLWPVPKELLAMRFNERHKEEGGLQSLWKFRILTIMKNYSTTVKDRKEMKKMNKMFRFSDVKWLKQFLFKCKFDFLKDGTTSNCTLNGKMKINLKYGMNKVYVDFLGIIFYYENPDAFSFAQSILDFGQLCLG